MYLRLHDGDARNREEGVGLANRPPGRDDRFWLLLAPGACAGWHGRGRRKNNVGDLARTRHHHRVACAGH